MSSQRPARLRAAMICHAEDRLDMEGIATWLASFSDLSCMIVVREPVTRKRRRIRREFRRVGLLRFLDVIAFRIWYRLFHSRADSVWLAKAIRQLKENYPGQIPQPVIIEAQSPNADEVKRALLEHQPDFMLARCKTILRPEIFNIPRRGTLVLHPGICPEYRNAHGGFWALAQDDLERIGTTLLRIDEGVDTGPVLGYFRVTPNPLNESPMRMQQRNVLEQLEPIRVAIMNYCSGHITPLATTGRESRTFGQPWLSKQIATVRRWKTRRGSELG